jgi:hypothetical protein
MSKIYYVAFALGALVTTARAQTNVFPLSGNVGIGTTTPGFPLEVAAGGARVINGNGNAAQFDLVQTTGGHDWALVSWGSAAGGGGLANTFSIYDNTLGVHRLLIDGSGRVGVGTTTPRSRLDVGGAVGAGNGLRVGDYLEINEREQVNNGSSIGWNAYIAADNGTYSPVWAPGTGMVLSMNSGGLGDLDFWGRNWAGNSAPVNLADFTHVLRLSTNGNVGIGTTTPSARLEIAVPAGSVDGLQISRPGSPTWQMMNYGPFYVQEAGVGPRFVILPGGKIGVGTTAPAEKLHVVGGGIRADLEAAGVSAIFTGTGSNLQIVHDGGGDVRFQNSSGAGYKFVNYNNTTDLVTVTGTGAVGIGTTSLGTNKLSVNDTIRAKEVVVEATGWSDYVFAENYDLKPLSEVEQHIKQHGHLPGIPSAADVAENGVGVGEMQAKLLAKVEELTLHLIIQQKDLEVLRSQNEALKARVGVLENK